MNTPGAEGDPNGDTKVYYHFAPDGETAASLSTCFFLPALEVLGLLPLHDPPAVSSPGHGVSLTPLLPEHHTPATFESEMSNHGDVRRAAIPCTCTPWVRASTAMTVSHISASNHLTTSQITLYLV